MVTAGFRCVGIAGQHTYRQLTDLHYDSRLTGVVILCAILDGITGFPDLISGLLYRIVDTLAGLLCRALLLATGECYKPCTQDHIGRPHDSIKQFAGVFLLAKNALPLSTPRFLVSTVVVSAAFTQTSFLMQAPPRAAGKRLTGLC